MKQYSNCDRECRGTIGKADRQTDRQTDRHADHNTSHPYRRQSSNAFIYFYYYFVYDKSAKYCNQRLCLSVCLSVRLHISKITRLNFTKFSIRVTCAHGWLASPLKAVQYVMYFWFCG